MSIYFSNPIQVFEKKWHYRNYPKYSCETSHKQVLSMEPIFPSAYEWNLYPLSNQKSVHDSIKITFILFIYIQHFSWTVASVSIQNLFDLFSYSNYLLNCHQPLFVSKMQRNDRISGRISWRQNFHNRLFKNPFTISKIYFFPQNFLITQTVEKIKKIQANLRQIKCIIDSTRNRASLHCLKIWAGFQEFPP